jgi:hypothetical protein
MATIASYAISWIVDILIDKRLTKIQPLRNLFFALFAFLTTVLIVCLAVRIELYNVRYNDLFTGTNLYFKNGTVLKSNDQAYYIGKTNKYVFYYDKKLKKSTVFTIDDIERIEFPSK